MKLTAAEKEVIKREVVVGLKDEPEVRRIVLFGSFLRSDEPNDMDVAVFQSSGENYLPLALKYRRKLRSVSRRIPVDVVPIRPAPQPTAFLKEIESGEVLYER